MGRKHVFAFVLAAVALVGCGASGPSLEGKWKVSGLNGVPKNTEMTAAFTGDKLNMTIDMSQDIPNQKPLKLHGDVMGTFKVAGEIMDVHIDDVKWKAEGVPEAAKATMDKTLADMGKTVKDKINENGKQKLKWIDADKFELSGSNETNTYTRIK